MACGIIVAKGGCRVCGRYNFTAEDSEEIRNIIREVQNNLDVPIKTGEIYPTNAVPVLLPDCPIAMLWGFPHFKGSGVIINARAETVTDKRMFRESVMTCRCVIPSTGFYEWKRDGNAKTKYLFRMPEQAELYMAGFYNRFNDKDGEEKGRFVILTTAANESMQDIHDRMPVILRPDERDVWMHDGDFYRIFDRKYVMLEHVQA